MDQEKEVKEKLFSSGFSIKNALFEISFLILEYGENSKIVTTIFTLIHTM